MDHARPNGSETRGSALLLAIVMLAVMSLGAAVVWRSLTSTTDRQFRAELEERAWHTAEAGLEKAIAALRESGTAYTGEKDTPFDRGSFTVQVIDSTPNTYELRSDGTVHDGKVVFAERHLAATLELDASARVVRYLVREEWP